MGAMYSAVLTSLAHLAKLLTGFLFIKLVAHYLGPEGLGTLGHFMSLVTLLFMLSAGGVGNGIIKYVAEYKNSKRRFFGIISASIYYAVIYSCVICFVGISFSSVISRYIFGDEKFYWVISLLALAQFCFSFSTIVTGVLNGLRDTKKFAYVQIIGAFIGLPVVFFLIQGWGVIGAALGLVAIYSVYSIPAFFMAAASGFPKKIFFLKPLKSDLKRLSSFSLMLTVSALTFPITEILVRQYLIGSTIGYSDAGIWQGAIKLSSAYLGFFGVFLAYYFMPIISAEANKEKIKRHAIQFLIIIAVLFLVAASVFYIFRALFIPILLSNTFVRLEDFLFYQLLGDLFKILSYVLGYVAVAKAAAKLYVAAEIFQNILFFALVMFIAQFKFPLDSVFLGYALTYFVYFLISLGVFIFWIKRPSVKI